MLRTLAITTLLLAVPAMAHASDMSGLYYVVVIWPVAIVLAALLLITAGIAGFRELKKTRTGITGVVLIAQAVLFEIAFTALCLYGAKYDRQRELALFHIAVFQVAAVPAIALGAFCVWRAAVRRQSPPAS